VRAFPSSISIMLEKEVTQRVGDYIEDGYEGHKELMPNDAYSKALDALVVACVDIIMLFEGNVILGKRDQYPQADWWLFGGRMRTGEALTESAARLIRNEAGITLSASRFTYITTFVAAWKMRAHVPQENGTHTVSTVFVVSLTKEEFDAMKLNEEYGEWKLVTPKDIISGNYHPALRQCAGALS